MNDLKSRILHVLKEHPLVSLATITADGKPWTRYIMTKTSGDLVIRSSAFISSRKVAQIREHSEVHLNCGISDMRNDSCYLQIQAAAIVSCDPAEKKSYWNDSMKSYFTGCEDPNYCVLVIRPYRIEYWSMGKMEPEVLDLK